MTTTPDWPSLWKREPALRPIKIMAYRHDEEGFALEHAEVIDYDSAGDRRGEFDSLPDDITAALCRDAAVRWLMAHSIVRLQREPKIMVMLPMDEYGDSWYTYSADTLDAALFAACEAMTSRGRATMDIRVPAHP